MSFFVMPIKHVPSVTGIVNCLGTPKLYTIAHENCHKTQKRRVFFLCMYQVSMTL
jgi:hypothetical protein